MKTLPKPTVVCLLMMMFVFVSYGTALDLKLPFASGEEWGITNGYGVGYHVGNDAYAIDFNLAGTDDYGKPVLAAANGKVVFVGSISGTYTSRSLWSSPDIDILTQVSKSMV